MSKKGIENFTVGRIELAKVAINVTSPALPSTINTDAIRRL